MRNFLFIFLLSIFCFKVSAQPGSIPTEIALADTFEADALESAKSLRRLVKAIDKETEEWTRPELRTVAIDYLSGTHEDVTEEGADVVAILKDAISRANRYLEELRASQTDRTDTRSSYSGGGLSSAYSGTSSRAQGSSGGVETGGKGKRHRRPRRKSSSAVPKGPSHAGSFPVIHSPATDTADRTGLPPLGAGRAPSTTPAYPPPTGRRASTERDHLAGERDDKLASYDATGDATGSRTPSSQGRAMDDFVSGEATGAAKDDHAEPLLSPPERKAARSNDPAPEEKGCCCTVM